MGGSTSIVVRSSSLNAASASNQYVSPSTSTSGCFGPAYSPRSKRSARSHRARSERAARRSYSGVPSRQCRDSASTYAETGVSQFRRRRGGGVNIPSRGAVIRTRARSQRGRRRCGQSRLPESGLSQSVMSTVLFNTHHREQQGGPVLRIDGDSLFVRFSGPGRALFRRYRTPRHLPT